MTRCSPQIRDSVRGVEKSTYGQPLSVIARLGGEESLERVVGRNNETSGVDEELSGNVEEDEEEVEGAETENDVDLGDVGLLLKLLQLRVLGQLLVELGQVELCCMGWSVWPRQQSVGAAAADGGGPTLVLDGTALGAHICDRGGGVGSGMGLEEVELFRRSEVPNVRGEVR